MFGIKLMFIFLINEMDFPAEDCVSLPLHGCAIKPVRAALLDTIPREILLHIFSFIEKEFVHNDGSLIYKQNHGGWYYPLNELYKTSHMFDWLREYEFVYASFADYYWTIKMVDINNKVIGLIDIDEDRIMGYKIGEYENTYSSYRRDGKTKRLRVISGRLYYEPKNCSRTSIECNSNCLHCHRLNKIEQMILTADDIIGKIIREYFTDIDIIIRPKSSRLQNLKLKFNASHLT